MQTAAAQVADNVRNPFDQTVRVADYLEPKIIVRQNIDESTLESVGAAAWVFNVYTDPKEQRSTGHRYFEWAMPRVLGLVTAHTLTYKKYPMKDLGLGVPR